jgi:hypothetical protein
MRKTTTIVSPPYFISFLFFPLLHTHSLSLSFLYVCIRMCSPKGDDVVKKKKKMSCLHICKPVRARTLHQRHRQKKQLQFAQKKERELFSLFACICICTYICNDVIVTSMPCLLLLFASEQINVLHYFFLFFLLFLHMYVYRICTKRNEIDSVAINDWSNLILSCNICIHEQVFLSRRLICFYDDNDQRRLGHSFVLSSSS